MTTGYQLIELVDSGPETVVVASDGTCDVTFGPVKDGEVWRIFREIVISDSVAVGPAKFFLDDPESSTNLRAGTGTGNGDIDSGNMLLVPSTRSLVVAWTGMTPGSHCSAVIQYERLMVVTYTSTSIPGPATSGGTG